MPQHWRELGPPIEWKLGDVVKHKADGRRMTIISIAQPRRTWKINESDYTLYGCVRCRYPRDRELIKRMVSRESLIPDFAEQIFFPFELERV